jgi:thiamine kinase-like enzyme
MLDTEELEARASKITEPEFIRSVVYPAVYGNSQVSTRIKAGNEGKWGCEAQIVQNTGTGRITVSYRFDDGERAFGKVYCDALGLLGNELTKGLWENGFGKANPNKVSEPLLYSSEHSFLLTRAAAGVPLLESLGNDGPEVLTKVRQAARWLVELHKCPLRIGRPESLWESLKLSRILHRITKAAARAPHERERMIGMVDRLCEKGKRGPEQERTVQTHGRYHHEHIFVGQGTVTLIDFDRSAPADPAKDLAEFVSVLRHRTQKKRGSTSTAEAPTRVFLEEYLSHLPANLENLAIHWGAFLLLNMFHYVKKQQHEAQGFESQIAFYEKEFDWIMSEKFLPN